MSVVALVVLSAIAGVYAAPPPNVKIRKPEQTPDRLVVMCVETIGSKSVAIVRDTYKNHDYIVSDFVSVQPIGIEKPTTPDRP